MAKKAKDKSIGELLRHQRAQVLKKGLREMARFLDITAPHLTDIEKGRRTPSEDLLVRLSRQYHLPEATLRAGWSKAEAIVGEVATQDPMTAEKVPELLRRAQRLTESQWDDLIEYANQLSSRKSK